MAGTNAAFHERGYLITGAASGIGLSTARRLSAAGARLALWDRSPAVQQIGAELGGLAQIADVTDAAAVEAAMQRAADHLGGIDGVIHCAGVLRNGAFGTVRLADHVQAVQVNLIGTLHITHSALPHLRARRGSLILMGSVASFYGTPEYAAYGASKAAVLNFAQALRLELMGSGVHVGVVCPHSVDTPMLDAQNRHSRVVRRFGMVHTPDHIAQAILKTLNRRQFLVLPGLQPRLIWWASRAFSHTIAHRVMSILVGAPRE